MDVLHREFSAELRAAMARNRVSANKLADSTQLSISTINRLTNARRSPTLGELRRIGDALDVPAWELVRRAEEAQTRKETA